MKTALSRRELLRWLGGTMVACALPAGCRRAEPPTSPLIQRGYLWQRDWTFPVAEALHEADQRLDGIVLLAGEIVWPDAGARVIPATIQWDTVRRLKKPVSLGLRVAPFPGPFEVDDAPIRAIGKIAGSFLDAANQKGVTITEFQLDFDCAQRKLGGYRKWLQALRAIVRPMRLIITALPSWLGEPEFEKIIREVDGYVLQVHSVPTANERGSVFLCNTLEARRRVERAARLGRPFSVSLPTYRCLAGYDGEGALLGVAMDSVQPAWPVETSVLELSANAADLAKLVNDWRTNRPTGLRELLWYRVPVATDARNWRWPTLSAVMAGRAPAWKFEVTREGENPTDWAILNSGETDEESGFEVTVSWENAALVSADALPGWNVQISPSRAIFATAPGARLRLSPGDRRGIGWLRHDQIAHLRSQVVVRDEAVR